MKARTPSFIVCWLPLIVHLGFAVATSVQMPSRVGRTADSDGVAFPLFLAAWCSIIGVANLAFVLLHWHLPRLQDKRLQVPGQDYWLATSERRARLIGRLRGILESALLGLNVFFLAVYQSIYQANVAAPLVRFDLPVLLVGFMVLPLLLVTIQMVLTLRRLAIDSKTSNSPEKEGT